MGSLRAFLAGLKLTLQYGNNALQQVGSNTKSLFKIDFIVWKLNIVTTKKVVTFIV